MIGKRRWIAALMSVCLLMAASLAWAAPSGAQCVNRTHVVRPGEGLYRIALQYGVSMDAIARANGIVNYSLLYAGQTLTIPCAGGSAAQPSNQPAAGQPTTHQPATNPQGGQPNGSPQQPGNNPAPGANCATMTPTSPLDGLAHGSNTFYWNGAVGITSYRVNVFGVDVNPGALVASFNTSGVETHVSGDLSGLSGFKLAWEVQGLVNGAVACTSQRYTMGYASA